MSNQDKVIAIGLEIVDVKMFSVCDVFDLDVGVGLLQTVHLM